MVADGSVGLGFSVTGFPTAWLGSEVFLAYCGIPHVTYLCLGRICRCDLGTVLHERRVVKCVLICDSVCSS